MGITEFPTDSIVGLALIVATVLLIALVMSPLFDRFLKKAMPENKSDLPLAELNKLATPTHADFSKIYEFVVNYGKARFPSCVVEGARLHGGNGYGVFVRLGDISCCLQVRSSLMVNGTLVENDLLLHDDPEAAMISGFDALEK